MSHFSKEIKSRGRGSVRMYRGHNENPEHRKNPEDGLRITVPNLPSDIGAQPIFDDLAGGKNAGDSSIKRSDFHDRSNSKKGTGSDQSLRITVDNERFRDSPSMSHSRSQSPSVGNCTSQRDRDQRTDQDKQRSKGRDSYRQREPDRHEEERDRSHGRKESGRTRVSRFDQSPESQERSRERYSSDKRSPPLRERHQRNDRPSSSNPPYSEPQQFTDFSRSQNAPPTRGGNQGNFIPVEGNKESFTQDVDYRTQAPGSRKPQPESAMAPHQELQAEIHNILRQNPSNQRKGIHDMANALKEAFKGTQWEGKLQDAMEQALSGGGPPQQPTPDLFQPNQHPPKMTTSGWTQISEPPPPETKPKKSILKKSAPASQPKESDIYDSFPSQTYGEDPVAGSITDNLFNLGSTPKMSEFSLPGFASTKDVYDKPKSSNPAIPDMQDFMNVEDEDKFLYGDDSFSSSRSDSQQPRQAPITSTCTSLDIRSYTGQFRDDRNGRNQPTAVDNVKSKPADRDIYKMDEFMLGMNPEAPTSSSNVIDYGHGGSTTTSRGTGLVSQSQMSSYQQGRFGDGQYQRDRHLSPEPKSKVVPERQIPKAETQVSSFQNPEAPALSTVKQAQDFEKKAAHDPTIANILKSIGFNFEMSQLMQEKAQKERELTLDTPEAMGIQQGSSFIDGGIAELDITSVFGSKPKQDITRSTGQEEAFMNMNPSKLSYEERARKYREEEGKQGKGIHDIPKIKSARKRDAYLDHLRDEYDEISSGDESKTFDADRRQRKEPGSPMSSEDSTAKGTKRKPKQGKRSRSRSSSRSEDDTETPGKSATFAAYSGQQIPPGMPPGYPPPVTYPGAMPYGPGPYGMPMNYRPPYPYPGMPGTYPAWPRQGIPFPPPGMPMQTESRQKGNAPKTEEDLEWERLTAEFIKKKGSETEERAKTSEKKSKDSKDSKSPRKVSTRDEKKDGEKRTDRTKKEASGAKRVKKEDDSLTSSTEKTSKRTVLPPKAKKPEVEPEEESRKIISIRKDPARAKPMTPHQRETLKQQMEERQQRLNVLEKEMERLRKQQNELMRKKQRERDGHKDPLIVENSKLQDEIATQISLLRKASAENAKVLDTEKGPTPKMGGEIRIIKLGTDSDGPERRIIQVGSSEKESSIIEMPKEKKKKEIPIEYYDPGNHWCARCNLVYSDAQEFFEHLHDKKHKMNMDPTEKPWVKDAEPKKKTKKNPIAAPFKGIEFLMPVQAIYCAICDTYSGDIAASDTHLKSDLHNKKYQAYLNDNPFYEKRFFLDKAAGLSRMSRSERDDLKEKVLKKAESKTSSSRRDGDKRAKDDDKGSRDGDRRSLDDDRRSRDSDRRYRDDDRKSRDDDRKSRDNDRRSKEDEKRSRDDDRRFRDDDRRSRDDDRKSRDDDKRSRRRDSPDWRSKSYDDEDRSSRKRRSQSPGRDDRNRRDRIEDQGKDDTTKDLKTKSVPLIGKMPSHGIKRKFDASGGTEPEKGTKSRVSIQFGSRTIGNTTMPLGKPIQVKKEKISPPPKEIKPEGAGAGAMDSTRTISTVQNKPAGVKSPMKKSGPAYDLHDVMDPKYKETREDLKLLGIEPTSSMGVTPRPPPALAAENVKPHAHMSTCDASNLYNVFFQSNKPKTQNSGTEPGGKDGTPSRKADDSFSRNDDDTGRDGSDIEGMMDMGSDFEILDECE